MKKVVRAVAVGIGVAAIILAILKVVKTGKKSEVKATKFYAENDNEVLGV